MIEAEIARKKSLGIERNYGRPTPAPTPYRPPTPTPSYNPTPYRPPASTPTSGYNPMPSYRPSTVSNYSGGSSSRSSSSSSRPASSSSYSQSSAILAELQRKANEAARTGTVAKSSDPRNQAALDKIVASLKGSAGTTAPAPATAPTTGGPSAAQITQELYRKARTPGSAPPSAAHKAEYDAIVKKLQQQGAGGTIKPNSSPYGGSITGFDANNPLHKQIADLSQQWGQASTQAQRDAIAAQSLALGQGAGGTRDAMGRWTFPTQQPGPNTGDTNAVDPNAPPEKSLEELVNEELAKLLGPMEDLFGGGGFMDPGTWQDQANQMGQAEYDQMMQQYQQLVNSLQGNQSADLNSLQSDVYGSQQQLEDTSFQDWMKARQSMADRGLAGSGIASDQDTRLLLDRGRQMARINQDAMSRAQQVRAQYSGKINEAQATMAGLNLTDMQRKAFQAIFESGNKAMMDRADLFLKYLKQNGDFKLGAGDLQFKYDQLDAQTKQFYDKLDSDEKIAFGKMDNENQQLAAKLSQDYNLKMSEIMGIGPDGKPTLDALKLAETIRHNQSGEINDANSIGQRAVTDAANLGEKIRQFDIKVQQDANKLMNTQWATQGRNISTQISAANSRITNITNQLTKLNPDSATYDHDAMTLQEQLKTEYAKQYSLAQALDDLTYGRAPGQGGNTGAPGGGGTSGNYTNGVKSFFTNLFGNIFKKSGSSGGNSGGGGGNAYNPK